MKKQKKRKSRLIRLKAKKRPKRRETQGTDNPRWIVMVIAPGFLVLFSAIAYHYFP